MSKYKKAVIALIVANIIWGIASPIFKWSLQGISPLELAFFRFFFALVIVFPFTAKKAFSIKLKDFPTIVLMALLNTTFNVGLYFIGLDYTASINQPVIASAGPIFVIIGSFLFLRDKVTRRILFGNLIGMAGVLFIVIQPLLTNHSSNSHSIFGNLLFILATIAGSMGTVVSKRLSNKYPVGTLLFWNFFVAALSFTIIPLHDMTLGIMPLSISLYSLTGIFFGAVFTSGIGYFLFYWGLKYIKASETSIFSYVDPVSALLVAAPLLHEYPNPVFIFGTFLIFLGIYIAEGRIHWHPLHKLVT